MDTTMDIFKLQPDSGITFFHLFITVNGEEKNLQWPFFHDFRDQAHLHYKPLQPIIEL